VLCRNTADGRVSEPLLRLEGLSKSFAPRRRMWFAKRDSQPIRAVDALNLTVNEGETVALVGESGCGNPSPTSLRTARALAISPGISASSVVRLLSNLILIAAGRSRMRCSTTRQTSSTLRTELLPIEA
jgi:ABC-type glutathione transport system ATPase component